MTEERFTVRCLACHRVLAVNVPFWRVREIYEVHQIIHPASMIRVHPEDDV